MNVFTPNRDLKTLSTEMHKRVTAFLEECKQEGIPVKVSEAGRSHARQLYLWSFGRYIEPAFEKEYLGYDHKEVYSRRDRNKVTWTLQSKHLIGEAIDIFFDQPQIYPNDPEVWNKVYDIAEKHGLFSLYRSYGVDRPHLELDHKWSPGYLSAEKKRREHEQYLVTKGVIEKPGKPLDAPMSNEVGMALTAKSHKKLESQIKL